MKFIKTILLLTIIFFCSCKKKHTLQMIKENPSNYVVMEHFTISNFSVLETTSFMNYSISVIDDKTERIILISSKPYNKSQLVGKEKVKYMRLYSDQQRTIELLAEVKSYEKIKSFGPLITNFLFNSSTKKIE